MSFDYNSFLRGVQTGLRLGRTSPWRPSPSPTPPIPPTPVQPDYMITENNDYMITESGDRMITE